MDHLAGLTAFVRTADLGSFVAAGRAMGVSASAVGKAVARLEAQLAVRLFQRSTRSLRLTEEGRLFHDRCRRVLDDLDDARDALIGTRQAPRGRLRISAPIVSYHFLWPILPEFMALNPEVELDIDFNDRLVDLIEDRIDVAIRSGDLGDTRMITRVLRPYRLLLCAAPTYLEKHGVPLRPCDLDDHLGLRFRFPNSGRLQDWPLAGDHELRVRTARTCNNMEAVRGAAVAGLGIFRIGPVASQPPPASTKSRPASPNPRTRQPITFDPTRPENARGCARWVRLSGE
jgi:DNA-binding transcriptional LysR family regulator